MKISIKKQIKEIIKQFNFVKVANVMKYLDWGWASCSDNVPKVEELKTYAEESLWRVAKDKSGFSSGGFRFSIDSDNCLSMEFIITEWDGYSSWDSNVIFKPYKEK